MGWVTSGAEMVDAGGRWGCLNVRSVAGFCVRDLRSYTFWARGEESIETMRLNRPERLRAIARPEGARPLNYEL